MDKKITLLAIDDDDAVINIVTRILTKEGYNIITASNGEEGLEKAFSNQVDLILSDLMMPKLNGFEVCKGIRSNPKTENIPVIMFTGANDDINRITALQSGVNDFLAKPFDNIELLIRIKNQLKIRDYNNHLKSYNLTLEEKVKERTLEIEDSSKKLKEAYIDTIFRLTVVSEYKDNETASHIKRMSYYAGLFGDLIEMNAEEKEIFFYSAPMHDIGKVGIPDRILLKTSGLTPEEFDQMKAHTLIGAKILASSKGKILNVGEIIALTHHEKWDGTGYPNKLKEKDIPLHGRLTSLIDVYDALRSPRPYKDGFEHGKAMDIIANGDGRVMPAHFDPELLNLFIKNENKFREIYDHLPL